jgi:xylulokinase
LPLGTPVVAGAADTAACLLGAGVSRPGERLLNLGTGAQLVTVVAAPAPVPAAPTTHRYRAVRGWYAMGAVQNAGLALGWALAALGAGWDEAEAALADGRLDTGEALFVPHLSGERTPLLDPGARGAWLGLGLEHGRAHLLRAAFEGVAHAIRHARDALDAEAGRGRGPLRLLGGGSLRPAYRQLVADTLGEPLVLLHVADATARGAALLAGAPAIDPGVAGVVEPRPAPAARAQERHGRWLEAVAALRAARGG